MHLAMCTTAPKKKSKSKAKSKVTESDDAQEHMATSTEAEVPEPVEQPPAPAMDWASRVQQPAAQPQHQPKSVVAPAPAPPPAPTPAPAPARSAAAAEPKQQPTKMQQPKQQPATQPQPAARKNGQLSKSQSLPADAAKPAGDSGNELGAVYSPSHVKITRADGQMSRTIAVSEIMDQLLLFQERNNHLLLMQEQLSVSEAKGLMDGQCRHRGCVVLAVSSSAPIDRLSDCRHANRTQQEQLKRNAEIINGLQNEVTMFRQMCLNLQREVSMLRGNVLGAAAANGAPVPAPMANGHHPQHAQPRPRCPPPPGMQ
ncbi:TPA: hypothetical protein N0F65_009119 [Lagenidium giganteum]|uniref:Uncharacterized protein n=1 Tax=Lagenidium giganteum TaxID=4803 RepID=A0AAV2YPE1_9STRA|nr:TPA: hypothetical protein N0F65_009119 [Lagenidium giganteum]